MQISADWYRFAPCTILTSGVVFFQAEDGIRVVAVTGVQTCALPIYRRLVRYRISAWDNTGLSITGPYEREGENERVPNFAYFVYDGVPAWRGALRPGVTPVVEYGPDVMRSLPVYHLIAKKGDVETSTWFEQYGGDDYKWLGTLVYDGKVYDHIRYRTRGGVRRYAMGKN